VFLINESTKYLTLGCGNCWVCAEFLRAPHRTATQKLFLIRKKILKPGILKAKASRDFLAIIFSYTLLNWCHTI